MRLLTVAWNADREPALAGSREAAAELGWEVALGSPPALPGAALPEGAFLAFAERLAAGIGGGVEEGAGAVLLHFPGPLAAETEDDPEGFLLAEVRSCLPPGVPLAVTCGFRANLSPLLVSACDLLLGPARPGAEAESGAGAVRLLGRLLAGEIQPVLALAKPPLLPDPERAAALAELLSLARAAEREPGVLAVTIAAGSLADQPHAGLGVVATADGDAELAAEVAHRLADAAWERREALAGDGWDAWAEAIGRQPRERLRRPLYPLDVW